MKISIKSFKESSQFGVMYSDIENKWYIETPSGIIKDDEGEIKYFSSEESARDYYRLHVNS